MTTKHLKSAFIVGAVVFAGVFSAAAPAVAFAQPLYDYVYYSDATKTVVVGSWSGVCYSGYAGVTQYPDGQVTAHYDKILVGSCTDDGGTIWQ
ncbi:Uncharacterised protein [Brevundimonas vesicularis]|uniref:Uncharacterized protein n=1 Tax=Brevundimonas vesicularis TaxID=41276 RepID=A0A2X1BPG9_BREVE|nr:hypothetical protein [Brevundimonas vesicularis]SPU54432.1 Uncharacterised protein [Brevundimonas vesicularis]